MIMTNDETNSMLLLNNNTTNNNSDVQNQKELSLFAGLNDPVYQGSFVYFEIVDETNSLSRMSTSSSCGPSMCAF